MVHVFKNWKLLFKNFCRNTCGWNSMWKYVKCCLKTKNCCLETLTKHTLKHSPKKKKKKSFYYIIFVNCNRLCPSILHKTIIFFLHYLFSQPRQRCSPRRVGPGTVHCCLICQTLLRKMYHTWSQRSLSDFTRAFLPPGMGGLIVYDS